jgi:3-oxoacyl-[acyl-carrier-protein] synthase II
MIACELSDLAPTYRDCIVDGQFHYERWGAKAMTDISPLWMLKYLPNMPACHIGIAEDIRGPTNSIVLGEVSSLAAVAEAVRALQRGQADMMLAGGVGSRVHPIIWGRERARQFSRCRDAAAGPCRPFDARRDGIINGEGAATFLLETEEGARARGAKIRARVLGFAAAFEPQPHRELPQGKAIRAAIQRALRDADLTPGDVGHVNAHGLSTTVEDALEAQAIRDTLGDVPVTAPKSFFGNLGAGGGAVEMAVSVLAFEHGLVPRTLNYEYPDPQCPVNVIHGQSLAGARPTAVVLNHTLLGQAIALVLAGPE